MNILIKGMDMPKSCLACDFCNPFTEKPYCRRLMKVTPKTTTLPDCPLVPVPPHGRLIDADELEYHADNVRDPMGRTEKTVMWEKIKADPTVIPADKDGDKDG